MNTQPRNFDSVLSDFLSAARAERGLADNSIAAYRRDLSDFANVCQKSGIDTVQAPAVFVEDYIALLSKANASIGTINRRLSALREFFKFCLTENIIKNSPMINIDSVKRAKPLPKFLDENEIGRLMKSIVDVRAKALLAIAFSTGLRVTELLTLPYCAITGDKPYTIVRGKGEKERIVIISDDLKAALKDYKSKRLDYSPKGRDSIWLFPSRGSSGHLTRAGFFKMLKQAACKAGLDQSLVSPHVLRHSFATYMLQNGADLRSLQKLLGHSSIATTEIYTHVTPKNLADTLMKKHPLARRYQKPI